MRSRVRSAIPAATVSQVIYFGTAEREGLFPGPSTFPVPPLGEACACCNAPGGATVTVDPSNDHTIAESVAVPVCQGCAGHLPRRETFGKFKAAFVIAFLVFSAAVFLADARRWVRLGGAEVPVAFGAGLAGAVSTLTVLVLARRRWLAGWAQRGHFRNFELLAGRGWSAIRSNNAQLVERLLRSGGRDTPARAR